MDVKGVNFSNLGRNDQQIRTLEVRLSQLDNPWEKIDALNELAWELRIAKPERALAYSQKASVLAQSGDYSNKPYSHGLAGSLVPQAFIETYQGNLATATSKCHSALILLQDEPDALLKVRAWYTLSWNGFFVGEYPIMLDYGFKALTLAREVGYRLDEAWILDVVACGYSLAGDQALALQDFDLALSIFREQKDLQGEMRVQNNLAFTLYRMKQYDPALDAAKKCLELARQLQIGADYYNVCCTLAQILIDMGRLDEAEVYLKETTIGMDEDSWVSSQVCAFKEWSRLRLLREDTRGAEENLLRGLNLAERLGQKAEQAACQLSLSVIYERLGELSQALAHLKRYQELQETVIGEQAMNRMATIHILYQVEAAEREAELYRQEAAQLQLEVNERKRIEETLRLSEEKYYNVFNSSPDAITLTRRSDGKLIEVNQGFLRLSGYTREEALSSTSINLKLWARAEDRKSFLEALEKKQSVENLEYDYCSKAGEIIHTLISGTIISIDGEEHVISVARDITERRRAEQELQEVQSRMVEQQRNLAKFEERQRIARDLHDSVNQSIHGMVLYSETLNAAIAQNNTTLALQLSERLQESARQSLKETRLMLYEMRSPDPSYKLDLVADLKARLAAIENHAGVRTAITLTGSMENCPPEWQENLFWIASEALNNAIKHAQANIVKLSLIIYPQSFAMEIFDNGKGFDPKRTRYGGMGLQNMQKRAELLGGRLDFVSSPGKGTRVRIRIGGKASE
jgi:PAS domain S-box-containing protein